MLQHPPFPKLPSVQAMLEGIKLDDDVKQQSTNKLTHRRHASTNSTIEPPHGLVPLEPRVNSIMDFQHHHHHQQQHRSPRNLHSRSFSDYTHPYPTSSPPHSSGSSQLLLHPNHRRAISTNTLDLFMQPFAQKPHDYYYYSVPSLCESSSSTVTTTTHEESGYASDETTTSSQSAKASSSSSSSSSTKASTNTTNEANRYICSYCNKGFSRPSSLRIHTYSHTGERPFECPEQGCSRKFSVQSNMRRHLRVHRMGKSLKRNGKTSPAVDRSQMINKPLAAKPIASSLNWSG